MTGKTAEEFMQARIEDDNYKECDHCGEEMEVEEIEVVEIDPLIKVAGYDYPHRFLVHKQCAEKLEEVEDQ